MSENRTILSRLAIGYLCLAVLGVGSTHAQEEPSADPQPVYGPPERIIYVPFKQFEDVFENQDASVVIPYAEYLELWALKTATEGADRKPVDAVITQAVYIATVDKDIARIQVELTVNVVGKPWVEVPLNFGEAAVGAVTSDDGDVLSMR